MQLVTTYTPIPLSPFTLYNIPMSKFEYKAQVISTGEEASGIVEAKDKFELSRKLKEEGKVLFSAKEIKGLNSFIEKANSLLAKIELRDKILFANNLATMIQAGLPLSRALSIILKQTQNLKMKAVLTDISENIN